MSTSSVDGTGASTSSATTLAGFKQQRATAQGNISRIKKLLEDKAGSFNTIDLECRLEIVKSYIKQVMAYQTEVERLQPDDTKRGEIEEICISTQALLHSMLGSHRRASTAHESTMSIQVPSNRLPQLKIPKFGGKYSEYQNFISCYKSLVHSENSLTAVEKFNHLIACLTDDALRTVKAFSISEENYALALARLEERYDNKALIFKDHIATLFELPKLAKSNASGLRQIVDTVSAVLDSLSHLGQDKDITHAIIIHLVLTKVDSTSKAKWDEQLDYKKLPQWSDCASVLLRRCQFLDVNEEKATKSDPPAKTTMPRQTHFDRRHTHSSFSCTQTQGDKCFYCASTDHIIRTCSLFAALSVNQRFEFVKTNSMCINCLKKGHSVSKCRAARCQVCKRPHNALLHKYTNQATAPSAPEVATDKQYQSPAHHFNPQAAFEQSTSHSMHAGGNDDHILLATAVVKLKDKSGTFQLARALLDSGSQVNFMTEELAQRLALKRESTSLSVSGIGRTNTKVKQHLQTFVKSRINDFEFSAKFFILRSISDYHPTKEICKETLNIPSSLELADPNFSKPQKVDLLLGADTFLEMLSVGQVKLGNSLPTLQKTLLGWIIAGKCNIDRNPRTQMCNLLVKCEDEDLAPLDKMVQRFWELEEIPTRSLFTDEQMLCENHFKAHTVQTSNGRFKVKLPFKSDPTVLGASFNTAKRRFLALERRLSRDPAMHEMYMSFMKEYLSLGHMSPTNDKIPTSPHYIIPHQCVLRPDSTTTKLRVVFDASSKTSTQVSLNEILMVGPTVQEDLYSTLLRFRLRKFAITADITKMYRQVQVCEADRNYQLILWRESQQEPLHIWQLNTVTYGTAPAPFLAIRCLKELSEQFKSQYPIGSKSIANDFYVDDLLSGAEDFETLEKLRLEVITILSSCGFKLAKWYSNHANYGHNAGEKFLDFNGSEATKALGISWKPKEDILKFKLEDSFSTLPATKRNILSVSSKLFDPLGLLGPVIIKAKILLQELWVNKLEWDESIPQHLNTTWETFKTNLRQIDLVSVPRFVNVTKHANIQIHGFADASMRAYGCCIYVRSDDLTRVSTQLLTAKSKVAPLKTKTLPRLELCAAHLLAKLWKTIKPMLQFSVASVTFWSDSEIILHWLKTHPSSLSTFVGNRIAEIQEWTDTVMWRHVPTSQNPADIVSRGCNVPDLMDSIWFTGPSFLLDAVSKWPTNTTAQLTPELRDLEKKKSISNCLVVRTSSENPILQLIERHSSFTKVMRIFAYVLRFVTSMRPNKSRIPLPLSVTELDVAFSKSVQLIQEVEFADELKMIKKSLLPKSNIQKLSPFIHEHEVEGQKLSLLRVGGRLLNAPMSFNIRCPMLLPKNTHLVKIYLAHLHRSNCHAGAKVLIGLLRQKIWLVNAREAARKTVRNCMICYKFKPILLTQIMGNLPEDRLIGSRPFWICGVDFCGPVYTTLRIRGRQPNKTYISVFVCFETKAVHLEAVPDLMSDSFLRAFSRFVGRRGLPKRIWCDNATNFVGAARHLCGHKFDDAKKKIHHHIAEQGVDVKFIPPRAPHFGGLWEAAVKSAKHLLVRTLANANLTYEELETILVEIEAILNSRPIGPLSEDPSDGDALTPGHLLIGCIMKALPRVDSTAGKLSCLTHYRNVSTLKNHFWTAWRTEYILELQQRAKWTTPTKNIEVGTLVIIHEDNLPPQKWMTGRVTNVYTGNDGKVRVAEVKTNTGLFKRAIHKLAPLPSDSQPGSSAHSCNAAGVE